MIKKQLQEVRARFNSFSKVGSTIGVPIFAPLPGISGTSEGFLRESFDQTYGITSPIPPYPGGSIGDNAEEFEVTEYFATIETRTLGRICQTVSGLKTKDYVIFENSSEYDKGCSYTYKVRHENVGEILGVLESLNPKELNENTYTIQKILEDFTSQEEIFPNSQDH